jgi:5'-phosphate synthase pdxT subunit
VTSTVGILGYQGCIEPHEELLSKIDVPHVRVLSPEDLSRVDRLILPGGESTTMLKFIKAHGMMSPLREFAKSHPMWGICAGSILLANEVSNPDQDSLKVIDIAAHRNFYGPQTESFTTPIEVDFLRAPIEVHFIRAPLLAPTSTKTGTKSLKVHATFRGEPVFFSQGHIWACSFHAELGQDTSLHEAFLKLSV